MNKIRAIKFGFFLLCIGYGFSGNAQLKHEIIINETSFGDYPAILLNLKNHSLIQVNNDFKEILALNADLWIEPGDPEIVGLSAYVEGVKHNGRDVLLEVIDPKLSDSEIKSLNPATFDSKIEKKKIKKGLVFLVIASDSSWYKVKIVSFKRREEKIRLEYQKISWVE